eukprot:1478837-Amphidinium_carterae.4
MASDSKVTTALASDYNGKSAIMCNAVRLETAKTNLAEYMEWPLTAIGSTVYSSICLFVVRLVSERTSCGHRSFEGDSRLEHGLHESLLHGNQTEGAVALQSEWSE